jgi:hypothetical protein
MDSIQLLYHPLFRPQQDQLRWNVFPKAMVEDRIKHQIIVIIEKRARRYKGSNREDHIPHHTTLKRKSAHTT